MRPMWKGYLTFGLVSIPVRAYAFPSEATRREEGGLSRYPEAKASNRLRPPQSTPSKSRSSSNPRPNLSVINPTAS